MYTLLTTAAIATAIVVVGKEVWKWRLRQKRRKRLGK